MRRLRGWSVTLGVCALLGALLGYGAGWWEHSDLSLAGGPCIEEVTGRAFSPDGSRAALTVVPGCGATVGFHTHSAVVPAGDLGDVRARAFLVVKGRQDVALRWHGDDQLMAEVPEGAQVFTQATVWDGVQIDYR